VRNLHLDEAWVRHHRPVAGDLDLGRGVLIPASELTWRFSRSSGPGGQSVNTTDSRVELLFDVQRSPSLPDAWRGRALERLGHRLVDGVLTVSAQQERSQHLNRLIAERRLTELLREATAPPARPRRPTKPSRASIERRLNAKRRRSQTKRDRRAHPDGE
jgi:ribosome-associated protein